MQSIFNDESLQHYLLALFEKYGIVLANDHFVYASGKHGDTYVNKDGIYVHPELLNQVTVLMALTARSLGNQFAVVAGPALGGIPLAQLFAHQWLALFGELKNIAILEKDTDGNYLLKRGYDQIVAGQRVLLLEDILTTGKSVGLCIDTLRTCQADVVQIINIWQRGEEIDSRDVPIKPLMKKIFPMYEPHACPLCARKIPVNTALGKGRQFLNQLNP
jgi:orotate phosphoribosyltransferase